MRGNGSWQYQTFAFPATNAGINLYQARLELSREQSADTPLSPSGSVTLEMWNNVAGEQVADLVNSPSFKRRSLLDGQLRPASIQQPRPAIRRPHSRLPHPAPKRQLHLPASAPTTPPNSGSAPRRTRKPRPKWPISPVTSRPAPGTPGPPKRASPSPSKPGSRITSRFFTNKAAAKTTWPWTGNCPTARGKGQSPRRAWPQYDDQTVARLVQHKKEAAASQNQPLERSQPRQ